MGAIKRKKSKSNKGLTFLVAIFTLVLICGCLFGIHLSKNVDMPTLYGAYVERYSAENDLDPELVLGVIMTESKFDTSAKSSYASGLMQLTDETAYDLCKVMGLNYDDIDLHNPKDNIRLGCYYLKQLIDKYGVVDTALAAYNGGPGIVDEWLKDSRYSDDGKNLKEIPYSETKNYVKRVNMYKDRFKKAGGIKAIEKQEELE